MADPVPDPVCGACRFGRSAAALIAIAMFSAGCSINLGSLSGSGEKDEAAQGASGSLSSLTETIRNNPNDAQAYNARGLLLAQGGKSEEALTDLNKAISLDPAYGHAYANRALVYRHTKRLELAMNDYNRAIMLDPGYAPAFLGRGLIYRARNQQSEALDDFSKAISLRPDSAEALLDCGLRGADCGFVEGVGAGEL